MNMTANQTRLLAFVSGMRRKVIAQDDRVMWWIITKKSEPMPKLATNEKLVR